MGSDAPEINVSTARREGRAGFPTPRGGRPYDMEAPLAGMAVVSPTGDSQGSTTVPPPGLKHYSMLARLRDGKNVFRNALLMFGLAQIFVVWTVVTSMVYLQDYALKSPVKIWSFNQSQMLCEPRVGEGNILEETTRPQEDEFLLRPPSCRVEGGGKPSFVSQDISTPANKSSLPLLFFFIGIEGSGHKFFEQVFRRLPGNYSVVTFEPELHLTFNESQFNSHPSQSRKFEQCFKLPYARPLSDFAQRMQEILTENGVGPYVRSRDSYPLGRVRTPLARPDLINMIHLDGVLYRLKVVVLLRDLAKSVRSASRMGYHGGDVGLQVRIVEDSMTHLDSVVRMLPCDQYILVNFDWIADESHVSSPDLPLQAASSALANFLELNVTAEDVMTAVKGARMTRPVHNASIPLFGETPLDEFFQLREGMWPLLAAARSVAYFWPSKPSDWPRALE